MAKSIKISPIKKADFPPDFKTQESALAAHGFVKSPGTHARITPTIDASGKYRTGLDKSALYIKRLSPEEKKVEFELIDNLLEKLKEAYGDIDFSPKSDVWKAFSKSPVKVSVIKLGNGALVLNPEEIPQHLLDFCWLRVDPRIAKSLEAYHVRKECPECQYYIENEEVENRVTYLKKKEINKAIAAFEAMPPTKKKWIAKALELPVVDDSSEEYIYNEIDTLLKQPYFGPNNSQFKSMSTISVFNNLLNITDERLEVKSMIVDAIRYNIYRVQEGGVIYQGSEQIASDREELTNYLLNDKNQKVRIMLEERLKAKKIELL